MLAAGVSSRWTDGNLEFLDSAGNVLLVLNTDKKVTIPDGITVDLPGHLKVVKGALAAGNANAFAFAWQNPETAAILVHRVIVDVTTAGGTAGALLDVGIADAATATADTLLDGIDLNAVKSYDNVDATDRGTNGLPSGKVGENGGTNDFITGKILVQNAAALVGKYYIFYTLV